MTDTEMTDTETGTNPANDTEPRRRRRLFGQRPKPQPKPALSATWPCRWCGTATPAPPPFRPSGVILIRWPFCDLCQQIADDAADDVTARVALLAEVLDTDLDPQDPATRTTARRLVPAEGVGDLVHPNGWPKTAGTPGRWAHVAGDQRDELRARLAQAQAEQADAERDATTPMASVWGPCGWCGQTAAVGTWLEPVQVVIDPHRRHQIWPLCPDCAAATGNKLESWVVDWPGHHDRARRIFYGLLFGPGCYSAEVEVKPYAAWVPDDVRPADADGCEHRFGYITAADRERAWKADPRLAPPEVRAEEAARRARAAAARALVEGDVDRSAIRTRDR